MSWVLFRFTTVSLTLEYIDELVRILVQRCLIDSYFLDLFFLNRHVLLFLVLSNDNGSQKIINFLTLLVLDQKKKSTV